MQNGVVQFASRFTFSSVRRKRNETSSAHRVTTVGGDSAMSEPSSGAEYGGGEQG
jgi:hypothetical protein